MDEGYFDMTIDPITMDRKYRYIKKRNNKRNYYTNMAMYR